MKSLSNRYLILSLKHSDNDALYWYRPNSRGYTSYISEAGIYSESEVAGHVMEAVTTAVPIEFAKGLAELSVPTHLLTELKKSSLTPQETNDGNV